MTHEVETSTTAETISARLAEIGAHLLPLKPGVKRPARRRWQYAAPMTAEQALLEVQSGRGLGVNLAASGWLCIDTETALGTAAVQELGYAPWSYPAKSGLVGPLADGSPNHKRGGAHFVFRVPSHWGSAWALPTNRTGFKVAGGGEHDKFDVLAGSRFIVAPPSILAEAFGAAYTPGPAFDTPLPDAPEWLINPDAPCPHPALTAAHACMIPDPPVEHAERSAESGELDAQLDQIPDSEWFAGYEKLLYPTGETDADGCPIYSWHRASNAKAMTSHNCSHRVVKFWGTTMPGDLGFEPQAAVTHLQLRAALRGVPVAEVMREMGVATTGGDLTIEALALPPLRGLNVDDAAAYNHFVGLAEEARAAGDNAARYFWAERASRCLMVLRAREVWNQQARAAAEAAGEVHVNTPVIGVTDLPEPVQQLITAAADTGIAPTALALPAVATRPVQQAPGPYPVHAMPPVLRAMTEEVCEMMAVPAQMVGPMVLAAWASACGPAITQMRPMWNEPGALWFLVAAPPGSRKTPVLKQVVSGPLREAQQAIEAEVASLRLEAELKARALEAAAAEAEASAEKEEADRASGRLAAAAFPQPGGAATIAQGAVGNAVQLRMKATQAREDVPAEVRLEFSDATPEALQDLLRSQAGRGFLVLPEGGRLLDAVTRTDHKRQDSLFYTSAHDEEDIVLDRIGRGTVIAKRPSLCMLMMVQPEVLRKALAQGSAIVDNGFNDRILPATVTETVPDSFFQDGYLDEGVIGDYTEAIVAEYVRTYRLRSARIKFAPTDDAKAVFAAMYGYIEAVTHSGCGVRAETWSKAAGKVVRLARIFAQAEVEDLNPAVVHPIQPQHFTSAWEIVYWHLCEIGYRAGAAAAATTVELTEAAKAAIRETLAAGARPWKSAAGRPGLWNLKKHRPCLRLALDQLIESGEAEQVGDEYRLQQQQLTAVA